MSFSSTQSGMNVASGSSSTMGGMNQMLEIFKMQYLMKFMDSSGGGRGSGGSLLTMFVLMGYDQFVKYIPLIFTMFWNWFIPNYGEYFGFSDPKQKDLKPLLEAPPPPPTSKSIRAFIQFERAPEQKLNDPRIDAVLFHVCNMPDVRALRFNGVEMIPSFKDPLMIDNDIWFKISQATQASTIQGGGASQLKVEPIVYTLATYDHDITWLHRFVDTAIQRFEQEKKNKLGSETYYFDQFISAGGQFANPLPKGFCYFTKSKFYSNRSLDNVYLRQINELKQRVEFFNRRRDWYDNKGIPHTLGIVMYGHPGCGKTSTIKAIANETKRHIFNIALSEIKTKAALKSLFYNDTVNIMEDGRTEVLNIPVKQRLYVIEDIDAMDSVVIKRGASESQKNSELENKLREEVERKFLEETQGKAQAARMLEAKKEREDAGADTLDLSTLLNVLDGVRETPGRIIILSTNYPERLDEALLRPGRFDIMVEFEKHPVEVIKMHMEKYYDITLTQKQWERLNIPENNKKWTPAEISQILFRNLHDPDAAIEEICNEDPNKLFKFSQLKKEEEIDANIQSTNLDNLLSVVENNDNDEENKKKSLTQMNSNEDPAKISGKQILETITNENMTDNQIKEVDINIPGISLDEKSDETIPPELLKNEQSGRKTLEDFKKMETTSKEDVSMEDEDLQITGGTNLVNPDPPSTDQIEAAKKTHELLFSNGVKALDDISSAIDKDIVNKYGTRIAEAIQNGGLEKSYLEVLDNLNKINDENKNMLATESLFICNFQRSDADLSKASAENTEGFLEAYFGSLA